MTIKIAVIGATRGCGHLSVVQALQAGHQVSVLVRDPARLQLSAEAKTRVTIHTGDVRTYEDVRKIVEGQDVIISAIVCTTITKPSPYYHHTGSAVDLSNITNPIQDGTICTEGTANILKALKSLHTAGLHVPRLISISSMGIGEHKRDTPYLLRPFYDIVLHKPHIDKQRMEIAIEASEWLEWILVRPALLTNGAHTGKYRVLGNGGGYTVSRADVADFIIKNLESTEWVKKGPVLAY
ncbi:hypothetical protein BC936DRAFT_139784 [Jimgerdemannia flammicorona]|uniref:NAD(P)-binding domain-containing protein n=1 Tax=Jimgerdemannia flammicorona TaxID=994334 RepID=A0A433B983_9FUNG|nr:hypothetical protein BC936DRAFT_139784 [Jimgerdemannia flammicorona]